MKKQTILITGATRGIGWALAQEAIRKKHKVILTGRDPLALKKRADILKKDFPNVEIQAIELDISNRLSIQKASQLITEIDILINNAGITADSTFLKMTKGLDDVISTNLTGVFNVTHALINKLNPGGQLIMMTSKSALFGNFGQTNYSAAKAGVIALTKTLAQELKKLNLRVNCVYPAAKTDMTLPILEKLEEHYGQELPKEWQLGSSSEVAHFIINDLIDRPETGKIFSVTALKLVIGQTLYFINFDRKK
ncbi:SDR family NAD(P)-dependent oxidoreductase [Lactococcus cremoris]